MPCQHCGANLDKKWRFCPGCGAGQQRRSFFDDVFASMARRMQQDLGEMGKAFEDVEKLQKNMQVIDLTPFFQNRNARGGGFTINIVQQEGRPPKVDVQTFGDMGNREIEQQLREQIGQQQHRRLRLPRHDPGQPPGQGHAPSLSAPKETFEPKTDVHRTDGRVVVEMELPGVKSRRDISVAELESSVEVKAIAGENAYFKILTKPERFRLTAKRFEQGKLRLEFS